MGGTLGVEVFAPLAVGAVLAIADWRTALQLAAIPAAITGVVFIFLSSRLERLPAQTHEADLRGLLKSWTSPAVGRLVVMMML